MAGIYILGMAMPAGCPYCICSHWTVNNVFTGCNAVPGKKYAMWGDLEFRESPAASRPEWCPLVSVPDHGRLGDLDAAVEKLKRLREYHSDDSQSGVFIAHGITQCIEVLTGKEAPTIIPASTADKEGGT